MVHRAQLNKWQSLETQLVAIKTLKGQTTVIKLFKVDYFVFLMTGLFSSRDLHDMVEEILKMQDFDHPNVMTLIGVSFDLNEIPSIVMPLMANGSLLAYLKRDRSRLLLPADANEQSVSCFTPQGLMLDP